MSLPFSRMELMLGEEALKKLEESTVAIFGVGGVGSYTAEGIARCGVGKIILIDDDDICITNINRQIHATTKTIGKSKVDVMADRIRDINPKCEVIAYKKYYNAETSDELLDETYDYVVDAIDTVTSKLDLIIKCKEKCIPIISSMGAGNKLDPTKFEVADISKTSVCPLAKVMRTELRKRNIKKVKVVYSKEIPLQSKSECKTCKTNCVCPPGSNPKCIHKRQIPGSVSFVPSVVGLIIAGEVIKDLINK